MGRVAAPRCHRAIAPEVARAVTDAARCVTGYGAAEGSCGGWQTSPMVHAVMNARWPCTISKFTVAQTLRDALKGQEEKKFTPPPSSTVR